MDDPADKGAPPAPTEHEQRWPPWLPVPFLVVVIAVVQVLLPPSVTVGPIWLIPVIELVGIPLVWAIWHLSQTDRFPVSDEVLGKAMAAYLCFLAAASALNAALLLRTLLYDVDETPGRLLVAGFAVLAINVLTFGLIYWWIDGGGPRRRALGQAAHWDFQFPQQAAGQNWTPTIDRLPVHRLHQHHRLQPDRHHAPDAPGQDPVHDAVQHLPGHRAGDGEPRHQHAADVRPGHVSRGGWFE